MTTLAASYSRFTQAYIWDPSPLLHSQLSPVMLSMLSELPQSWGYCTREYTAARFGDSVSDVIVCIHNYVCTYMLHSELININSPPTSLECGFGKCIYPSYDDGLVISAVPLHMNTLSSPEEYPPHPYYSCLRMNGSGPTGDILHPEYPAAKPIISGYTLPYGM